MYGEYLAELTGDLNSANKKTSVTAEVGVLELQSPMYEEEAFSEGQGKEVLEWDYALESCENGEAPYPAGAKTEAECLGLVGPAPAAGAPVTLHGGIHGRGPQAPADDAGDDDHPQRRLVPGGNVLGAPVARAPDSS